MAEMKSNEYNGRRFAKASFFPVLLAPILCSIYESLLVSTPLSGRHYDGLEIPFAFLFAFAELTEGGGVIAGIMVSAAALSVAFAASAISIAKRSDVEPDARVHIVATARSGALLSVLIFAGVMASGLLLMLVGEVINFFAGFGVRR